MPDHWLNRNDRTDRTHFGRRPSWKERRREQAIVDWYGPERGRLEIMAHQSGSKHIHDIMPNVIDALSKARDPFLDLLRRKWPDVVGEDVARNARPVRVGGSCLHVGVESGPWLYVLRTEHKPRIEAQLRILTKGRVTTVRFVPHGGSASEGGQRSGGAGRYRRPQPQPRPSGRPPPRKRR